ncbi:MAG: redoxin domain-containing protein [Lachnospiraceae bacterium]|nr:redoxin domain-containing protein [Lachnospiraceae bacterium]
MGLTITDSISVITVLLQGFLSFFSPCVLPLLPLYIGYLSGGASASDQGGERVFDRKKVLLNTLFFVIGIGFSFFLLGFGMRAVGRFFSGNRILFARIGGIIVILFGLYQTGILGTSSALMKERRLPVRFDKMAVSPLTALIMGFVFSFAWTPCVGPTLSAVLLMAASAKSSAMGFVLVGVYTLGFALPFLLTGIFTASLLSLFKKYRGALRYTSKIAGILMILMGIMMVTGHMNSVTGYLSQISGGSSVAETAAEQVEETAARQENDSAEEADTESPSTNVENSSEQETAQEESDSEAAAQALPPAPDFTLKDQYGKEHTLSEYKGRVVFLNFWATWCPPCRAEMPDIQELYEESVQDPESGPVILGVAFPGYGNEKDEEAIKAFLQENGYTYPTVMDTDASLMYKYYITAFPTTFMIDRDGNVFGYVPGSMSKDVMEDIIRQTSEGKRNDAP